MSKVDELISQLCPNGVRVAILDEICEVANNKRKPVKSSLRVSGSTPYYGANNIQDYVEGFTHDGEYVLIAEDGSASLSNYSVQFATGKFWANNHVHVIKGKDGVNNRFLFHFFGSMNFTPYLTGGTRAKLNKSKLLEIKIPIPPLEVQKEIASILDKFTQLEAELSAELDARRKQYEYYCNQLFAFDATNVVRIMPMSEIMSKITDGSHNPPKASVGGLHPMISAKNINNGVIDFDGARMLSEADFESENRRTKASNGDLLMTIVGTVGRLAVIKDDTKMAFQRSICVMTPKSELVSSDYVKYFLETTAIQKKLNAEANGSAQKGLYLNQIKKIEIPVPPLDIQQRIVHVLDKFDRIVNDISEGLPAEISARRQQYEYYRTKLLTFQEIPA